MSTFVQERRFHVNTKGDGQLLNCHVLSSLCLSLSRQKIGRQKTDQQKKGLDYATSENKAGSVSAFFRSKKSTV